MNKKGFTLLELIVVIAIISLLTSIILASLSTSRAKANDTAIKSNLTQIKNAAGLQYENMKGCYSNINAPCSAISPAVVQAGGCPGTGVPNIFGYPQIASFINSATTSGSGLASCASTLGGRDYAVAVQYKTTTAKGWCVDSSGKSKEVTINPDNTQGGIDSTVNGGHCN